MDTLLKRKLLREQREEITAHFLYKSVAKHIGDEKNRKIIERIAEDELTHYNRLKEATGQDIHPKRIKIVFVSLFIRIFGLTFGIKLFERSEGTAIQSYKSLDSSLAYMDSIIEDETRHENALIDMLDEEGLAYVGSVVLGLNDALVELTGALTGYTIAFQDTRLIGLTGLITGISASFSMAASEYLSTKHEGGENAGKSALYTGLAYVATVIVLVAPFFLLANPFLSLGLTIGFAVLIIFAFNYYIAVAKDYPFRKRFFEMAGISLGVSAVSFLIGILIKHFIGVDI